MAPLLVAVKITASTPAADLPWMISARQFWGFRTYLALVRERNGSVIEGLSHE
jgi:hypothetical protein